MLFRSLRKINYYDSFYLLSNYSQTNANLRVDVRLSFNALSFFYTAFLSRHCERSMLHLSGFGIQTLGSSTDEMKGLRVTHFPVFVLTKCSRLTLNLTALETG